MDKLSTEEIAEKVFEDGLGNCIFEDLINSENIEDEHLASLWGKCESLMDSIDEILKEYDK